MSPAMGIGSLLPLQLILLLSGGGLMGTPPGERDAAYENCAPQKSLVYYEWSPSVEGKPGAPGVDGFVADPEIQEFRLKLNTLMTQLTEKVISRSPEEAREILKDLPEVSKIIMGKSGCFYLHYVFPTDFDENTDPMAAMVGINGTIILNAERQADRLEEILCRFFTLIPEVESAPESLDHFQIPIKDVPFEIVVHRHGSYLIFGWGKETIQRAIDGLDGKVKGLGESEEYRKAMDSIKMDRTAAVSWIDTQGAMETGTKILGPPGAIVQGVAAMTGLSGVKSIATITGVMENQIRTRSLVMTDGKTEGILSLASGRNMLGSDLLHIPKDSDLVIALSLNHEKMLETFRSVFGSLSGNGISDFEEGLSTLEEKLGIKLEDDILAAFGDVWTFYNSPSLGGVLMTSPMITLEVENFEKAKNVYDKLIALFRQMLPETHGSMKGLGLKQYEFMGHKMDVLMAPDDDFPFVPTFCLTEKLLFIAMNPQTLKAHFRLSGNNAPSFVQKLSNEIPVPSGDIFSFSYINTDRFVRLLYAAAPYVARYLVLELKREDIDVEMNDLPSIQAILPYLANSWTAAARVEHGILFESQSPLPVAGGASLIFNLPMFLGVNQRRDVQFKRITEEIHPIEQNAKPRPEFRSSRTLEKAGTE